MSGRGNRGPGSAPDGASALSFWILGVLVLALGAGVGLLRRQALLAAEPRPVAPRQAVWIDPGASATTRSPEWVDPRWLERVQESCERQGPFEVADRVALATLAEELAGLSFVRRVERCQASEAGGLVVDLELRQPVACLASGADYLLVSAEGIVLDGAWPVPPRLGASCLPLIGPPDDELLARARPGDWLVEPEHLDALDVALSFWTDLQEHERSRLGHLIIDARSARRASVEEPGVRLELEGGRLAAFGRTPSSGEPGELPVAAKWRSLLRAVTAFEASPETSDWRLVDLRWDRPELVLAPGLEPGERRAALDAAPPATRSSSGAGARARGVPDGRLAAASSTELPQRGRPRVR